MTQSRLRLFSCPFLLFILTLLLTMLLTPPGWAQKGEAYRDMATPQVALKERNADRARRPGGVMLSRWR